MILREVGMENNVLQAPKLDMVHVWQARDGRRIEHAVLDHAKAASPFGNEHGVPVRQKYQSIRMGQAFRQLNDPNRYSTCALEHDRLIDRGARQSIWRILAGDLSGCKRRRDARCVERLSDRGKRYTRQSRDRYGQTDCASHSPSTDIIGALCWHWHHCI